MRRAQERLDKRHVGLLGDDGRADGGISANATGVIDVRMRVDHIANRFIGDELVDFAITATERASFIGPRRP